MEGEQQETQSTAVAVVASSLPQTYVLPLTIPKADTSSAVAVVDHSEANLAYRLVDDANLLLCGGLHKCQKWGDVMDLYFEAGARFARAGLHHEAATAFNHAAGICRFLGTEFEVLNAVGYAVDSYQYSDPLQAAATLREQADAYQKHECYLQAAKCQKDCAEIHERIGNAEEALQHYERAVVLYAKDFRPDSAKKACEARIRHLLCVVGRFADAAAYLEAFAEVLPSVGLSPTNALTLAVLSHLAGAYGDRYAILLPRSMRKFSEYQDQDVSLRKGKERELLTNIFQAFEKLSLAMFDAAVAKYRAASVSENLPTFDVLALKCRDNLYQVMLPYM